MNQGEIFSKEIGRIDEDCKVRLREQIDYSTLQGYKNIRFLGYFHLVINLMVLFCAGFALYLTDKNGYLLVCIVAAFLQFLVVLSLTKSLKREIRRNKEQQKTIFDNSVEEIADIINRERKKDYLKNGYIEELSYDIGTPLDAIIGLKDKIFRESTEPRVVEDAAKLNGVMSILHAYIEDLNVASRLGVNGLEIKNEPYDLGLMLCDIENLGIKVADRKGVKLKFDINPDIPAILMGDAMHLELIILKIIANGLKYTDEGMVTLSLGYIDVSDKEVILNFSVEDTGQGIKEEDVERFFSKSKAADDALIEGQSLAMCMSKKLLEKMGSELRVESKFAQGTAFRFSVKQEVVERIPVGKREDVIKRLHDSELKVRNIEEPSSAQTHETKTETVAPVAEKSADKAPEPPAQPFETVAPAPAPQKPAEPALQTEDELIKKLSSFDELFVSDGIQNAGSEELYKKVIGDFCDSAAAKADDIEMYFEKEDIRNYTIEVHALKSAARIIGYKKLSKLAEALEDAGNAEDMVRIKNATGELLKLYREIAEKIESAIGEEEDKMPIDEDSLKDALRSLKEFAEVFDFDSVDFVMNELKKYSLPDDFKEKYAKLKTLVAQVARDDILKLLEE